MGTRRYVVSTTSCSLSSTSRSFFAEHVQNTILPQYFDDDASVPPLHVISYAIRTIIKPTVLVAEIPRLLVHLGHVEHARAKFMNCLQEVKRLDREIRARNGDGVSQGPSGGGEVVESVSLTNAERNYIKGVFRQQRTMRSAYRRVISEFSLLHAWDTWCSPNHERLDSLLKIYFPCHGLWGDEAAEIESQYLFHEGLDDDERDALLQTAQCQLRLLQQYVKDKKKKRSPLPASTDFRTRYALQVDIGQLVGTTMWYLNELEDSVDQVESILAFSGSTTQSPVRP
ncbi:hypothetical protein BC835DRAFT_1350370 [Cytidiella melzeri]|nr:hypothetical protein BC835DRAFT_1350370 [Cytidiella melzeri]